MITADYVNEDSKRATVTVRGSTNQVCGGSDDHDIIIQYVTVQC